MGQKTLISEKKYSSSLLYTVFIICFTGGVFGGITSTLMSSYLPAAVNDLLGDIASEKNDQVSAVINSMFLFGMMFGGILAGVLGDKKGRKIAVQVSFIFIGIFTLLTSFATSWPMVVVFRFFTGFGVGAVLVTTTILIDEIWPGNKRAIALGILSITIPVGIFSAGIITYCFSEWRNGFLIGILPVLLAIVSQWILPESNKWKQSIAEIKEQPQKQRNIFQKETRFNLIIGSVIYGAMLIGLWAIFSWLPTWIQSLIPNTDGHKEIGTGMMMFAVGGLSGGFISGWVSNFLGMKKTMIICFIGTFVFSFILFKLNTAISIFSYLEMLGIAIFFGISQGVLNVYIPELFPVSIRSSATGFSFNAGRIFTASAVFFVGWLVTMLGGYGNALFIFSFIFLIGLIATIFSRQKQIN